MDRRYGFRRAGLRRSTTVRRLNLSPSPEPEFRVKLEPLKWVLRFVLLLLFWASEDVQPFIRVIQPEEMWLYRNPITEVTVLETIGGKLLKNMLAPPFTILFPLFVIVIISGYHNAFDGLQAAYAYTLSVPISGIVVNTIKIFAGRPRPDFLARCYSTYYLRYSDMSRPCAQTDIFVYDGRKSFPSGHTGLAACCFGFTCLYLAGQIKTFAKGGKNRLTSIFLLLPLMLLPVIVGIARTCDYKHHWQDVLVGGLIGLTIAFMCYRSYYPAITDEFSEVSYVRMAMMPQCSGRQLTSMDHDFRGGVPTTTEEDESVDDVDSIDSIPDRDVTYACFIRRNQ